VDEYLAEPTGVDTSQLVPGGSVNDNRAALARVIARASSQADEICRKPLAATVDIQSGEYRIRSDGTIWVPVDYAPIVQVNAISLGWSQGSMAAMTDLSGVRVERKLVKIPVAGAGSNWTGTPRVPSRRGYIFADVTYVNGWVVTTTSQASLAGASLLNLTASLGVAAGLRVVVADGANTETVTVGSGYVSGSLTVPTAAPLQYAHGSGVSFSALPGAAKDAVILLTSSRIKMRGAEAVQMAAITSEPSKPQPTMPGGTSELAQAKDMLLRFRRAR
jgi:hypothetical protein